MEIKYYVDWIAGNDLLVSLLFIIASVIGAKILYFILETYVSRLTKATKTTLDDELLHALKKPVYIAAILIGIYFSLMRVEILKPHSFLLNRAFMVSLVVLGAFTLSSLLSTLINWYGKNIAQGAKSGPDENFIPIIRKIVAVFIYALSLIIVLDQLGVKVTALVASLGVASLAIALALQETLSNFFAGMYIMADKPVKPSDYIRLETAEEGVVQDIGWRSTKIKMSSGNILIIPNAKLAQNRIINYHLPVKETSFSIQCGVSYGSDLDKVEKVAKSVAFEISKKCSGIKNFEPQVMFNSLGDSNIIFTVSFKVCDFGEKGNVTHNFIKELTKAFKKEKIDISFPARNIYVHKSR